MYQLTGKQKVVIISVAVVGGFILAAFTIQLIYKKRHSCRVIIVDKAKAAKSNNYKSTLGREFTNIYLHVKYFTTVANY